MAMIPRRTPGDVSTYRATPAALNSDFGNRIQILPEAVPVDNAQYRAVASFLRGELQSSWHPSIKFTTVLIRSIADCLHAVSSEDHASMTISCGANGKLDDALKNTTIRQAVENVRLCCRDAIDRLEKDMDSIAGYSQELHEDIGPLRRLLRTMFDDKKSPEGAMERYIQEASRKQRELVNRQIGTVNGWYSLAVYVSNVKGAVDEELAMSNSHRDQLEKHLQSLLECLADAKSQLCDSELECSKLKSETRTVTQERDSLSAELKSARRRIQLIQDEITLLTQQDEDLRTSIEEDQQELKDDEDEENAKRNDERKDPETGAVWRAVNYCWVDAETQRRDRCDQDFKKRRSDINQQKARRKEIRRTKRALTTELNSLKIKKGHLEDGRIGELDENVKQTKLSEVQSMFKQKRDNVKKIEANIEEARAQIEKLEKYQAIAPDIWGHFSVMENSARSIYNAFDYTLGKLKKHDSILNDIANGVRGWGSNGSESKDVIETTLNLRYRYIVIQHMSRSCSTICKEIFIPGISEIAHLGTAPQRTQQQRTAGSDFSPSSRQVQYHTAPRDIEALYVRGTKAAQGFERMNQKIATGKRFEEGLVADEFTDTQRACLEALYEALRDVIDTTPPRSLWPSRLPRMLSWTGIRRQRALEDWATSGFGSGASSDDVADNMQRDVSVRTRPHEVWGGRTLEPAELNDNLRGDYED